jgi:dynein heavy chain
MAAAERFDKIIKKMAAKNPNFESMPPFLKLRETITGFKDSLPLIEMLKNPAIQERHWKRIMEETG